MLPLPAAITSQLDKASIIRLTISYLKLRDFSGHGDPPWSRDGAPTSKTLKGMCHISNPFDFLWYYTHTSIVCICMYMYGMEFLNQINATTQWLDYICSGKSSYWFGTGFCVCIFYFLCAVSEWWLCREGLVLKQIEQICAQTMTAGFKSNLRNLFMTCMVTRIKPYVFIFI